MRTQYFKWNESRRQTIWRYKNNKMMCFNIFEGMRNWINSECNLHSFFTNERITRDEARKMQPKAFTV